ncbi:MAG TPA: hypothetical protein VHX65_00075 [Pirellulales bacterium]|nr:hypothetical protein [Pirellulales bacterium]
MLNSWQCAVVSTVRVGMLFCAAAILALIPTWSLADEFVPDDFPRFVVPGHDGEMALLRELFWHHYKSAGPLIPVWDAWMPMSTLWPVRGDGAELQSMRGRWAAALAGRVFDAEGYVSSQQHDGPAHAEGWPFPTWMQAGGIGWHFAPIGVPGYEAPHATSDGWHLTGAHGSPLRENGWPIEITAAAGGSVTLEPPQFAIDARIAPWLRLNWWATGLEGARCSIEWTTSKSPGFGPDRHVEFAVAEGNLSHRETRTMIPVYRLAGWNGTITDLRIGFKMPDSKKPSGQPSPRIVIKSFHTACDSRHNINDSNFIRGAHDYFMWTADVDFLRSQIGRIRTAMRFNTHEFQTRQRKCIYTTWPGHEGRSGVRYAEGRVGGPPNIVRGEGIGSNYWDLLPFGGEDALATIYYYDSVLDLAELEEQIAAHPQWKIVATDARDAPFDPADLRRHAKEVRDYGTQRFWNQSTGRFGTVDLDGMMHDYGFTFLNNEAVYYNFATREQAKSIHAWLSGRRIVDGDTATGADIYHWRFGPRSTTRRNLDYYFWGWSNPASVPWGNQVQDGGAVLGFSFHDLMARLKTAGADDAAGRLREILAWYADVRSAGGYREYYRHPGRGTLQGGNVAGGIGVDREFFESILVPQVMLYGFLGVRPTTSGCDINPQLPHDWPELTITRIHLHDHVLDIHAAPGRIDISDHTPAAAPLQFDIPARWRLTVLKQP